MPATHDPVTLRARSFVETLTRRLLAETARTRQGGGRAEGARAPAALAQPRRVLVEIAPTRREADPSTPLGYRTAIRALPPALAALDLHDPRRQAAGMIADAAERIGSVGGGDPAGGDTKGGVSDGGATTRVKWATRLRLVEAAANGWPVSRRYGVEGRGPARVVMAVQRQRGKAQSIKALPLLLAVCVEGQDMAQILRAHGWSGHGKQRRALLLDVLAMLDDAAELLGLGRAIARKPLDR